VRSGGGLAGAAAPVDADVLRQELRQGLEKHLKAHPFGGATCPIRRNTLPARVPAVRVGLVVVRVLLVS
jgi:hypothetical protein